MRLTLRSQPPDQCPVLQGDHSPIVVECSLFTVETVQFSTVADIEALSGSFVPHVCPTETVRPNRLWLGPMAGNRAPGTGSCPSFAPRPVQERYGRAGAEQEELLPGSSWVRAGARPCRRAWGRMTCGHHRMCSGGSATDAAGCPLRGRRQPNALALVDLIMRNEGMVRWTRWGRAPSTTGSPTSPWWPLRASRSSPLSTPLPAGSPTGLRRSRWNG